MERLNKYLAHAGVGSRRHCDSLVMAGRVTVDGQRVVEPGTRVDPAVHKVAVDGVAVKTERLVYWLVNKPMGVVCTNYDPAGRVRAVDLVPQVDQRVYTVGRLDQSSEGLLLLTNDGDLALRLMHPRYGVEKSYLVQVQGDPPTEELRRLERGIFIAEGKVRAERVKRLKMVKGKTTLKIVLKEGKNREIRRMLAKVGHKVLRLRRTAIGPVQLGDLEKGKARKLTGPELDALKQLARPDADA